MGTMLLGSVPTLPRNPRSSTKAQSARQSTVPATRAKRRASPSQLGNSRRCGPGLLGQEVDAPAVSGVEGGKGGHPGGKKVRLRRLHHLAHQAGQRARRGEAGLALPGTSGRLGLELRPVSTWPYLLHHHRCPLFGAGPEV